MHTFLFVHIGGLKVCGVRVLWCLHRHSQAELRAFLELPAPPVAHRAAADVAVLAEIVKALARVAGVDMQGLMTLECQRQCKGTFAAYEGKGCTWTK